MTKELLPGLGSGALREALAGLFELVESGELVRDVSRDGQSDWHMRMLKMTLTLKKAQEALSLSSPIEPSVQYQSAVSGLLYEKRGAAGDVSAVIINGEKFVLRDDEAQASSEIREAALARDARRYWRLRVLGAALCESRELREGNVLRFTNLDAAVDDDIRINPSRGEAELAALAPSRQGAGSK